LTSRNLIFASSEFGNIVTGVFTPVLAKHSKSFSLVDTLSVGVYRIQRNFEPMQRQVESWRSTQITDAQAKLIFHSAFVGLLPDVDRQYFEPEYFGVLAANDVELVERIHQRFQEARSGSAVQGDGQVGGISQSTAGIIPAVPFTVVTARAGSAACFLISNTKTGPPRSRPAHPFVRTVLDCQALHLHLFSRRIAVEPCGPPCLERACSSIAVLEKLEVGHPYPLRSAPTGQTEM
jgi:hypothetical protein